MAVDLDTSESAADYCWEKGSSLDSTIARVSKQLGLGLGSGHISHWCWSRVGWGSLDGWKKMKKKKKKKKKKGKHSCSRRCVDYHLYHRSHSVVAVVAAAVAAAATDACPPQWHPTTYLHRVLLTASDARKRPWTPSGIETQWRS